MIPEHEPIQDEEKDPRVAEEREEDEEREEEAHRSAE
jgi:hypothetical protein